MFQDLLIYSAPALTLGLGYFIAKRKPDNSSYWQSISERNHRKFVNACKDANALEDELANANASIARLTDALTAKNERLERIAAQETTGANATVKRMAAIARGEA